MRIIKKTKNILVTGANGFVGNAITKRLSRSNNKLFLVVRDKKFKYQGAKIYYGDLSNLNFCRKIVSGIDEVYYLAGYKRNIAYHTKYPNDFVLGNVGPLLAFLSVAKNSNIKKIIYLSSANVGLYKTDEKDGYIVGKYINELILESFAKQYQIDIKIVRSAGIYGPGDNFSLETANFIPAIIKKVYSGEEEILVWGKGKRQMQFIFIEDLVSNLISISKDNKKFFIIGNNEVVTVNQIVKMIIKVSGKKIRIKNDLTKPDKATQLFKFNNILKPKFDLSLGLEETIKHYNKIYA